jgi:hypothetical protein
LKKYWLRGAGRKKKRVIKNAGHVADFLDSIGTNDIFEIKGYGMYKVVFISDGLKYREFVISAVL